MLNFIFDSKLADILAPVVPTNKLFLAIQHYRNDEFQQLMLNNDLQRNADGGYAAIHVACRHNNRFALEAILSKGVPVESVDNHGNTPLHYACKYGHLDICKYLIELRASPCRKNNSGETPYDVAGDHHTVRQYMLPLQFQAERSSGNGGSESSNTTGLMGLSSDSHYNNNGYGQTAPQGQQQTYGMPPPQYGAPPAYYGAPVASYAAPAANIEGPNPSPTGVPGQAFFSPPPAQFVSAAAPPGQVSGTMYNHARPAGTTSRIIQPDGFHTSASDPLLQKKYGHIQQTINVAPPPTGSAPPGGAAPYNMYSMQGAPAAAPGTAGPPGAFPPTAAPPAAYGAGVYSRYVPYDAHNNTAAPVPSSYGGQTAAVMPPASSSLMPQFLGGARPGLPTHVAAAPPAPATYPSRTLTANNPATTNAASAVNVSSTGNSSPSQFSPGGATPVSGSANNSAPGSQRLLGNKALTGGDDLFNSTRSTSGLGSHSGEEEVIITANSSSSAVL